MPCLKRFFTTALIIFEYSKFIADKTLVFPEPLYPKITVEAPLKSIMQLSIPRNDYIHS